MAVASAGGSSLTHVIKDHHLVQQRFGVKGQEVKDPPPLLDVRPGVGLEGVDLRAQGRRNPPVGSTRWVCTRGAHTHS